jgi:hypothetical protein
MKILYRKTFRLQFRRGRRTLRAAQEGVKKRLEAFP